MKPNIEWIDIPAGTFIMGSPESEKGRSADETQHLVAISAFKMSKYEITFDQYDSFCKDTGYHKPDDEGWGREKNPVINIDWHEANAFAFWMNSRLPTEAEWEYSCRAGSQTPFNTGFFIVPFQANCAENDDQDFHQKNGIVHDKTIPVGSYSPNDWGLYDMHGNVNEWCSDFYGAYPLELENNPIGPILGEFRVIRGGSWDQESADCRSAKRDACDSNYRYYSIGFRIVSLDNIEVQKQISKEDILILLDHTDKIIKSNPSSVNVFSALRLILIFILEKHFNFHAIPYFQSQAEGFSYDSFLDDSNKKSSIEPILDFIELNIHDLKNININSNIILTKEQSDRELMYFSNLKKAINYMLQNL